MKGLPVALEQVQIKDFLQRRLDIADVESREKVGHQVRKSHQQFLVHVGLHVDARNHFTFNQSFLRLQKQNQPKRLNAF